MGTKSEMSLTLQSSCEVVLVVAIETGEIELVIDQVVQDVFEGARYQLPEIDGDETWAGVDVFVAGHGSLSKGNSLMTLDIPFGSRQDAGMKRLFLQLR